MQSNMGRPLWTSNLCLTTLERIGKLGLSGISFSQRAWILVLCSGFSAGCQSEQKCVKSDEPIARNTIDSSRVRPKIDADNEWIVRIRTTLDGDMFPSNWSESSVSARAEPLDSEEIPRSIEIMRRASAKYHSELLKYYLDRVYVVGKLSFRGIEAGGTNAATRVYVVNRGVADGRSDDTIERVFHMELSSILLRNHPNYIDKKSWTNANPEGFVYGFRNGVEAIKSGKSSLRPDPALAERGFYYQYAMSSFENDFNAIAGELFMSKQEFWMIVDRSPRLSAKVDMVIEFYHQVDPLFTRDYFRGL